MFTSYPSYSRFRTLVFGMSVEPAEDVYALQTGLNEILEIDVVADGVFGQKTSGALKAGQRAVGTDDDGKCGPETWRKLTDTIGKHYRERHRIAYGALYGSLSHESSFRGGNYSTQRENGTYDAGVAQMNTAIHTPRLGFDMGHAINELAKNTRDYYDLFEGVRPFRRWNLAQGAWNAPAYAAWYAKAEGAARVAGSQTARPGVTAARLFDAYCVSVGAYLRV